MFKKSTLEKIKNERKKDTGGVLSLLRRVFFRPMNCLTFALSCHRDSISNFKKYFILVNFQHMFKILLCHYLKHYKLLATVSYSKCKYLNLNSLKRCALHLTLE